MAPADPPTDETEPSLAKVREAVKKLESEKAARICNISAEMLKAGSKAVIRELHAILSAVWQSGAVSLGWKMRLVVPIWKNKGDQQYY